MSAQKRELQSAYNNICMVTLRRTKNIVNVNNGRDVYTRLGIHKIGIILDHIRYEVDQLRTTMKTFGRSEILFSTPKFSTNIHPQEVRAFLNASLSRGPFIINAVWVPR